MSDSQYEPRLYTNDLGEKRYQPRLPDGQRAWWYDNPFVVAVIWGERRGLEPFLKRSRQAAIRKAKREHKRQAKGNWEVAK